MSPYPAEAVIAQNSNEGGLLRLLARLLQPVARLCLAHGITFATVKEILKRAFVQEAGGLQSEAPDHGMVSRISTATGINRREVTRLTRDNPPIAVTRQPRTAELLARWLTDPSLRDDRGMLCPLPRTGEGRSFEALAQLVTRDVHPRSLLDELIRLGMVQYDEEQDQVALSCGDFVPKADLQQMLAFLSDNVGDHLEAAVENVATGNGRHLEQAIFADELSPESIRALQPRIIERWQALREEMVPVVTKLIEADRQAGRPQDQRIRIGLYSYTTRDAAGSSPPARQQRRRRSTAQQGAVS